MIRLFIKWDENLYDLKGCYPYESLYFESFEEAYALFKKIVKTQDRLIAANKCFSPYTRLQLFVKRQLVASVKYTYRRAILPQMNSMFRKEVKAIDDNIICEIE